MSCPYFEENYFGICCASVSRYLPGIETMERYCFRKLYRLCPTLLAHRGLAEMKEAS